MELSVVISTKNRYFTTLPLCLQSIVSQTKVPKYLYIYDDSDNMLDLRNNSTYRCIFRMLQLRGVNWYIKQGLKKGQHFNHNQFLSESPTDIIYRVDDDCILEPNVLENLYNHLIKDDKLGGVGCSILHPEQPTIVSNIASSKIEDIKLMQNVQWFTINNVTEVDHFYSSFMFKKSSARPYNLEISKYGQTEETIFSLGIKLNGYKLEVIPNATIWHYHNTDGGRRNDSNFAEQDNKVFNKFCADNQFKIKKFRNIILNSGIGDNFAFKSILNEVVDKYKYVAIYSAYPDVFDDVQSDNVKITNLDGLSFSGANYPMNDIYAWMAQNQWDKSIVEAYRCFYGIK